MESLLGLSAVVPSLLLLAYFQGRDLYPEPARVLWTTFGLGVLSAPFVALLAFFVFFDSLQPDNPLINGFVLAFFGAALPEELLKLMVLFFYSSRHEAFDEPMDGIVYGVAASLGFATLENILYVSTGDWMTSISRALTAVPAHAFFGAIMGYWVGRAHFSDRPRRAWLIAYFLPVLLHGLYDYPLLSADAAGGFDNVVGPAIFALAPVVILVVTGRIALRYTRELRLEQVGGIVEPTSSLLTWVLTLVGGLMASLGGVVLLGMIAAYTLNLLDPGKEMAALGGTLVLGALPTALGAALFFRGLRGFDSAM